MENADEDLFQDNLASHPFSFKKKKQTAQDASQSH